MSADGGSVKLNQSVLRAIALLRATAADENANVSSLARDSGLPRATALRLIQTLAHEGFVLRIPDDERVLLGPELLRLGRGTDRQLLLQDVARPIIGDLVEAVRETVTLSVVGTDGALDLVEQVDTPQQLRPGSYVGRRFPLHATASGKLLLSTMDRRRLNGVLASPLRRFTDATITDAPSLRRELERVRDQGYAVASDEEEEGLTGVASGFFDSSGLLGVVTVAGPSQRLLPLDAHDVVTHLRSATQRIEESLRPTG